MPPPRLDLALRVRQRQEPVRVEAFVAQTAVERLYKGVVGRLAGPAEVERDAVLVGQRSSALETNSGPLSTLIALGAPRISANRLITVTTCSPRMPWSTSMASASRVNASTTVKARSRRPSKSASETKSIDQSAFGAVAAGCRSRSAALTCRRGRFSLRLRPSSRYSR